jgi:hypothetical protein
MPAKKKPGPVSKTPRFTRRFATRAVPRRRQLGLPTLRRHVAGPRWKKGGQSGSYDDWTVDDLRKRAKDLGLSGYSGKNKPQLVSMLRNH